MKRLFILFFIISTFLSAQSKNNILLVVPEKDSVQAWGNSYRLSASTLPESRVTLNGEDIFVYESGAFCGVLDINYGVNKFELISENEKYGKATKVFYVYKNKPHKMENKTFSIHSLKLSPSNDAWLTVGDVIAVKVKATSGQIITWFNGNPLAEIKPGVYSGNYVVRAGESRQSDFIKFIMTSKNNKEKVIEYSTNKIEFKSSNKIIIGETIGDRPALSYGLGTNRLGGAKMEFIEEGIKLNITGKIDNMYRVALTDNQEAWIDEENIKILSEGTPKPHSLTNSWSIQGFDNYDLISIALTEKLPYSSYQILDPSTIVVNIYGAVSNSNWLTQLSSSKEIKNVYYRQIEKNLFRVFIELKHKQCWGYAISYKGNTLTIKVKRQPVILELDELTIAVDAGHGGWNNGAMGSTGLKEKTVNLAVAELLRKELEWRGATVIMTREDDSYTYNSKRLAKLKGSNPDISVSIHSNSIGLTTNPALTRGTATFYKHIAFRPLSQFILKRMKALGLPEYGNVGSFNFTLNSQTDFPNVLVETAFLSNPEDEMLLMSNKFRRKIASAIADGIQDFLDSCD